MSGLEPFNLHWTSPGPVSQAFMDERERKVQILNGPYGSGKTTTNLLKHVKLARQQAPSPRKRVLVEVKPGVSELLPVRMYKLACIRDTYRQLWKTTIPSWLKRFPKEQGWTGTDGGPAEHRLTFLPGDGSVIDFWLQFAAIGENSAESFLDGFEVTAFFLNAINLMSPDVLTYGRRRTGRYPDIADGGPTWHGVTADCNAPEFDNWLYKQVFVKRPPDIALFIQPGGRDPNAENLANLPGGAEYYKTEASEEESFVSRMIDNKAGYSRSMRAVYAQDYSDARHVPLNNYEADPDLPIGLGLDAGLHPAAVIGQRMPNGQRRLLDELVGEPGTGAARFGDDLARLLNDKYPAHMKRIAEGDMRWVKAWADPTAANGVDKKAGEASWIQIVGHKIGIIVLPAPSNAIIRRLEAVRNPLRRTVDGQPGLLINPRCEITRVGFNSGYGYKKLHGYDDRYSDEIDKNEYSHPHDSVQYWCSGDGEDMIILLGERAGRQNGHQQNGGLVSDFDPYGADRIDGGQRQAAPLNPAFAAAFGAGFRMP